ncbi:hypothetical protein PENSUB_12438 [Penicillium subrubescens]|uniref:Uncharacterized protein n=1 Tax=Penicillium subrubescens TaxID=1316194 RepID=A0A1Q5SZW3_9EURO|nr:hypothetical protein PENSUB_12438 [Penicillium subrubescens]
METLLYLENNGSGSPRSMKILFFCLRPNWFYFSTIPASILTLNGEFSGVVDVSKANGILLYDSKNHIPVSLHPSTSGIAAIILDPLPAEFPGRLGNVVAAEAERSQVWEATA